MRNLSQFDTKVFTLIRRLLVFCVLAPKVEEHDDVAMLRVFKRVATAAAVPTKIRATSIRVVGEEVPVAYAAPAPRPYRFVRLPPCPLLHDLRPEEAALFAMKKGKGPHFIQPTPRRHSRIDFVFLRCGRFGYNGARR